MNRKAQITLEAVLLIVIVVAGLLAVRGYYKRALQGGWRSNIDSFSDEQYRPGEDDLQGAVDPQPTQEMVSDLEFVGSTMTAKSIEDGNVTQTLGAFIIPTNTTSGNVTFAPSGEGILQIGGWGTYHDSDDHEDEG